MVSLFSYIVEESLTISWGSTLIMDMWGDPLLDITAYFYVVIFFYCNLPRKYMPQEIAPKTFTFHGVDSVKREGKKGGELGFYLIVIIILNLSYYNMLGIALFLLYF